MKRSYLVLIVVLCFASVTWAQLPPVTNGTCNVSKMLYLTSSAPATTPTTPAFGYFADMYGIGVSLTDVTQSTCVKIEVSFVAAAGTTGGFELRALYDGNPDVTVPSSVTVLPGTVLGYHTFSFLVVSGPGDHGIDIQVRSTGNGAVVTRKRMVIVTYN